MTTHDFLDPATRHWLTVEEYLLLDRKGAFGDRDTASFDGEVYYMSPKHRPHARAVGDVYFAIRTALRDCGSPLTALIDVSARLSDHDVPEPDIVVADAPEGQGIVPLGALKLVIDVADASPRQGSGVQGAVLCPRRGARILGDRSQRKPRALPRQPAQRGGWRWR